MHIRRCRPELLVLVLSSSLCGRWVFEKLADWEIGNMERYSNMGAKKTQVTGCLVEGERVLD
jgi:hypothetical protein